MEPMPEGAVARILRIYGPWRRWQRYRLYGRIPNGHWHPLLLKQLVGGKNWSISLVKIGPMKEPKR